MPDKLLANKKAGMYPAFDLLRNKHLLVVTKRLTQFSICEAHNKLPSKL
jgi:hypothetical protein